MVLFSKKLPPSPLETPVKPEVIPPSPIKRILFPTEPSKAETEIAKIGVKEVGTEIPEATEKVLITIGKFVKTVQEEIMRSGASVGLTLTGVLTGKRTLDISGPEIENKVARVIFGDRPLKSIETRIAEGELGVKDFAKKLERQEIDLPIASRSLEESMAKFSEENALALSILGIGATIGIDFTGAGGSKTAIKAIAKSKSPEFIAGILRQINVADDLIPAVSKKLAGITDEKAILQAINKINEIQKTSRVIKEVGEEGAKRTREAKPMAQYPELAPKIAPERPEAIKEAVLPPKRVEIPPKVIKPEVKKVGNWELGQERPFVYDPNSTINEGRFRLLPPDQIKKERYFRRKSTTPGVSYVMGKNIETGKTETQAIRFNKNIISEKKASIWWEANKNRFNFATKGIKGVKSVAPKIELPKVILPTLKAPKGLEITARRATEINKVGISPEEFIPALEAQKRGTIPFEEMTERAVKLNKDLDDLLKIKPGTIKEPIEVERFRLVRNGLQKDVEKLRQNYVANPTSKNKAMLDEAQGRLNQAYVKIEGIRSEYGRGLSATRIDSELDIAAKNLNEIRLKLEPEKQLIFDKRLEALNINNPSEVVRFITEFRKAGIVEKVLEWWKAMLLSAPITHIRNFTGNTLFVLFDIPVRAFAGGLDAVRSVFGRPRMVYAEESLRMVYNGLKALPDATTEAIRAMRDEFYQYGARRMTIEAGMRTPAIKGLTGRIVRIPYRALSAMDLFSRKIKLTMETDALAYRMAKQKGFKGAKLVEEIEKIKRAPPIELINLATKKADRALFLEEMTGVLKSLEGMKNRHPTMQFIIPFYRTPVNLVREAYRLTPLRFMGKAKNFDPWLLNQSTQMEEISRTILGSLIGGTIVWKMVDGSIDITGTAPRGTNERALFYRQGKQPYSVRIGDNWYSYREIHPFATIMFGAAQIGEAIKLYQERGEITDKEVEDRINRLITDTSLYIQDLTFFQGLGNFVEAISGGSYNQGLTSIGPNYLGQLLGGFIPNLLYSYQRAADPTIYSTKGFEEQIKKRIPGMAESLISKRDIYGQPLERPGTFWQRFLSPVQVSQEKRDLVDMEMEKLEIAVGYPGRTAFGEPLTDFEWDAYLQDSGARLYEGLHDLMISKDYEVMTNYEKQKEIEYIVRISREDSRYGLFENKKDIADYKKGLLEKGYNEAEAEEMAEKEFGIKLAKKELYKPKIRPGIMPIKAPRERILFSGE